MAGIVQTVGEVLSGMIRSNADGTAPVLPVLSQLDINRALRTETTTKAQDQNYRLYQAYYDGYHADPRDVAFGDRPADAPSGAFAGAHNVCPRVIDAMAERMSVRGFEVSGDGVSAEQGQKLAETLWSWWTLNRMDETQTVIHAQAPIKGDAYVLADWCVEDMAPRFTFHDALEILPVYDAAHTMIAAYKSWEEQYNNGFTTMIRRRITRYTTGKIEKFASEQGGAWHIWPHDLDGNGNADGGIIEWTDKAGNPLPIPIIHYRNKPLGGDWGRSELAAVIPLQDEYNRRVMNTSEAMSYQGGPLRYAANVRPQRGPNGEDIGVLNGSPDQIVLLQPIDPTRSVDVGQWQAGQVVPMQDVADRELKSIGAVSATPIHLIWPEGGLPSGEALKTAEAPLLAKCQNRAVTWGNAYEDLMHLAILLENTFGAGGLPEELTIDAKWDSFATRDDLAEAQLVALIRDEISGDEALRRLGYDAGQIKQIQKEKDDATPPALRMVDRFARSADTTQQQPVNSANAG